MKKTEHLVARFFIAAIGLLLCGVGVGIFLYSGLGVDPASVFELGLANVTHLSYGTATAILNVIILAIVFLVDRHYINISSILAIFLIGYVADFMKLVLGAMLPGGLHLVVRLVMIFVGLVIMSTGIATYIRADLGVGAIDLISEIISDKLHITYRIVRMVGDITFVVVGFLLGGTVGIGTVVAAFMTGPVVQFMRPLVYRVTDRFAPVPEKEEISNG